MSTGTEVLQELVRVDRDQVFLLHCPASIPAVFASHPWFVVNKRGRLSRWEVAFRKHLSDKSWGYLQRDLHEPFSGIEAIPYLGHPRWGARLVRAFEGEEAKRLIEVLEGSPQTYPLRDSYSFTGPNSNTYARWALDQAGIELKLPRGSVGEHFPS